MHTQYILGLEIPMGYTLSVHEAQGRGNLTNYLSSGRLTKALVFLYAAQQLAAVNLKSKPIWFALEL